MSSPADTSTAAQVTVVTPAPTLAGEPGGQASNGTIVNKSITDLINRTSTE